MRNALQYTNNVFDVDRWANLNTLLGYKTEYEDAMKIQDWLYENGMDLFDMDVENIGTIKNIAREIDVNLDFSKAKEFSPRHYEYY